MTLDTLVLQLAARQGGIVCRHQLLQSGFGRGRIDRQVSTGRWKRLMAGVYRILDLDEPRDRLRAAVAALPEAVVSHESAAEYHDVPALRRGLAVVTVHTRTTHSFPGVIVHRTGDLEPHHVVDGGGLPTTSLARTVLDLSACLRPAHLEDIVDDLVAARRLELADLAQIVTEVGRRGKTGSAALRSLIEARIGAPPRGSRLERLGLELLRNAGFPDPETEYPIPWSPKRRFDVAYPDRRLAIEWDSRRWHTQAEAFEQDRRRDRQAVVHGWRLLRFAWLDVIESPGEVAAAVRAALTG